jgi:hypothetical protein
MQDVNEKITAAELNLIQLKNLKKIKEARIKEKEKNKNHKEETRRKILLGSYLMQKMKNDELFNNSILGDLDLYLTKQNDRDLFDLLKKEPITDIDEITKNFNLKINEIKSNLGRE